MPPQRRGTPLVVNSGSGALGRQLIRQSQHRSGNTAVVDGRRIRGEKELLGGSAKVIGNPIQLRVLEDCRPRHNGVVCFTGAKFIVLSSPHFRCSPSARVQLADSFRRADPIALIL